MPRKNHERKTLSAATAPKNATVFEKESAAAAASVDILDSELETAAGYTPTTDQFTNDHRVVRVPVTSNTADEAAATISVASVARNGGDTGFTVTFSTTTAAGKKVKVRVVTA